MKVQFKRRVAGEYDVMLPAKSGPMQRVGAIYCDGRPGVDNYPWTWVITDYRSFRAVEQRLLKMTGVTDTFASAKRAFVEAWGKVPKE